MPQVDAHAAQADAASVVVHCLSTRTARCRTSALLTFTSAQSFQNLILQRRHQSSFCGTEKSVAEFQSQARVNEKSMIAMDRPTKSMVGRRGFLRALGTGSVTVAAARALNSTDAAAVTESNEQKRKARYVETAHVKTFYRVNRYPG